MSITSMGDARCGRGRRHWMGILRAAAPGWGVLSNPGRQLAWQIKEHARQVPARSEGGEEDRFRLPRGVVRVIQDVMTAWLRP
jgi:hypothetical protein